ncbi:MAG: hypothetical protein K8R68_06165, partial [Bacteroidales bacterium]|nr:hypothetical protein [Bacteroidales bacterium]
LANLNEINIHIDPAIEGTITNNFTDVSAREVILFLCREYDLDLEISGNIISIFPYEPPVEPFVLKELNINKDSLTNLVTVDFKNDTLYRISKELTKITGINIVVESGVRDRLVTAYVQNANLSDLLEEIGFANSLKITNKGDYYRIGDMDSPEMKTSGKNNQKGKSQAQSSGSFYFQAVNLNDIEVNAIGAPIKDIINEVSRSLKINYFILNDIAETITVNLNNVTYEELLDNLLNGTNYTYIVDDEIYIIGERQIENLRQTRVIQLVNRSVEKITETIPQNMSDGVEIFEFMDLNSLVLSGSRLNIKEIENFIQKIDKVVPVILIEVIIVSYKKGFTVATGVQAGLSKEPVETTGSIVPIDITLSSSSINNILSSFNGGGLVNLGRVTPNFYVSLKALETNGVVKVRSTPKLSTLNGHEANMLVGNTEYYLEEKSQIFANQTTTQEKIRQFKPINADFTLTILPVVSGDDQITLDISVEQSDFTGTKLAPDAPPDQVNRSFKSLIRIRNEEMILLGGLEDKTYEDSSSGVPLLSRIPVIKWLFSSRKKVKSEDKLNIFIKPTVIY